MSVEHMCAWRGTGHCVCAARWLIPLLAVSHLSATEHSPLPGISATRTGTERCCDRGLGRLPLQIEALVSQRQRARAEKNYATADDLKTQLAGMGMEVVDSPGGATVLSRIPSTADVAIHRASRAEAAKHEQKSRCVVPCGGPSTQMSARQRRNKKTNANHRARKVRGRAFANWVVETFGDILLCGSETQFSTQGEVLDVAGGSGIVSWELVINHGIRTSVIDPRPMRLSEGKSQEALLLAAHWPHHPPLSIIPEHTKVGINDACLHPRAVRRTSTQDPQWKNCVEKTCVMLACKGMAQYSCLFTYTPGTAGTACGVCLDGRADSRCKYVL